MKRASISIAISSAVLCACGSEPTAATVRANREPPARVSAAKTATTPSPMIAIDDAVARVVPSLDAATGSLVKGPLIAVAAALKAGDSAALRTAIVIARQALARPAAANDALAPDLDAIALALDAAAAAN